MSIEFNWVNSSGSSSARGGEFIYASQVKAGSRKGGAKRAYQFSITIPEGIMRKARLVCGDRVIAGFAVDPVRGQCIAIKRVINGGFKITPATGGKAGSAKEKEGQVVRGRVQISDRDGMPTKFTAEKGGYEIDSDGTLIAWELPNE